MKKMEMTFTEFIEWLLTHSINIKAFKVVDDQDTYQTVEFTMVSNNIITIIIFF